jgi:hypothetical protein
VTLTARIGDLSNALEFALDLALVLERLEGLVASLLDVAGGLNVERSPDILEGLQINPKRCQSSTFSQPVRD